MSCDSGWRMAMKVKLMKFLQEVRGLAEVTNRRRLPKPPMLYLMELRSHVAGVTPRHKVVIAVDMKGNSEMPDPVHIKHIKPEEREAACSVI